jgi:multiple sugar transport system ATP-binding protein
MTLADKIVLLNAGPAVQRDGSVAQIGAPLDLYHRPVNLFVAGFIGSPRMNLLTGKISSATRERAEIVLPDGTRATARVDAHLANPGDRATLGIRPEHVQRADQPGSPGVTRLTASHVEHVGGESYLYLEGAALGCSGEGALVTMRESGDTTAHAGDPVDLALPESDCHLFDAAGKAFRRLP